VSFKGNILTIGTGIGMWFSGEVVNHGLGIGGECRHLANDSREIMGVEQEGADAMVLIQCQGLLI
jgi:hypothetical protein